MKRVCVHQPNFMPHAGYFIKAALSDILVIYDTAQYSKGSYTNRVRIREGDHERWLTVPTKASSRTAIRDVRIDYSREWQRSHLDFLIRRSRHCSDRFSQCLADLKEVYSHERDLLCDFNIEIIRMLHSYLGLECKICLASEVKHDPLGNATEKLLQICKSLGADSYLSGKGGFKYMDIEMFETEGIRVEEPGELSTMLSGELSKISPSGLSIVEDIYAMEMRQFECRF